MPDYRKNLTISYKTILSVSTHFQVALIYTKINFGFDFDFVFDSGSDSDSDSDFDFDFDFDSDFDIFRAITVTLKTVLNFTVVSNSTNMRMTTLFSNMAVQMA